MPLPVTSKYIGVTTLGGHVARALDFQERTDVWVTLSKNLPWEDPLDPLISDTNPPVPSPASALEDLEELVVLKKATLQLVVPDNLGTVIAYGAKWRIVIPQEARDEGARWVLVTASFDYNEAPISAIDSYLTAAAAADQSSLVVANAAGYQVGDDLLLGLEGQETTVDTVNLLTNTITVADELTDALLAGTFISNLTYLPAFNYRQVSLLSHVVANLAAPGQLIIPYARVTEGLLEYYYNSEPIPRKLNRRDDVKLILTF